MFRRIKEWWLRLSLRKKIGSYTVMVALVMGLSVTFSIQVLNFALDHFNVILYDNSRCHDFQEAMELEVQAFAAYVRKRSEENRSAYVLSCVRTERCLHSLPDNYEKIGAERYAQTWNIQNGYDNYRRLRDALIEMDSADEEYIPKLYEIYNIQSYLQTYARRLVQATLKAGNAMYQQRVSELYKIPYLILLVSGILFVVAMGLTRVLANTLVEPLVKLAHGSRKIAKNDFSGQDLVIENQDEMGELVTAFNKMKHSTEGFINTLKKNHEMTELLHKEELEKIEMEKRLDAARLEFLKSQINPHFLFNTLNTISCMAKLEKAATTERMIASLSSLFRYNLKMSEQVVFLEQELKVAEDYVFIQQMRFGERIRYDHSVEADARTVRIPAFTLQPLVENAVLHGLARKEQGGRLHLRIWKKKQEDVIVISVADTGIGMSEDRLKELREAVREKERRTAKVGIGLGNIYKRIYTMYGEGRMTIHSKEGKGTVIQMMIPQETEL